MGMIRGLLSVMERFIWVVLAFSGLCHALLDGEVCPRRHHALLIALLPLHRGFDCRELVQKGVQQRVALEEAVKGVNTEYDLQIALKVMDTCSDREKAVEVARKADEFVWKRCSKYPVFLGYLGPDDEESLTGMFDVLKHPQVVPAMSRRFQHTAIPVDVVITEEKARRISTFLKYLNWYSFILIFTSDTVSSGIAMTLIESGDFCLTNTVLEIPSFASGWKDRAGIYKVRRAAEGVQNFRIVILTDDDDVMGYFTDYVEEEWGGFEYVVYTQTTGILPWKSRISPNAIILQEVPKSPLLLPDFEDTLRNSTLWLKYLNQLNCDGCRQGGITIDPTVMPYVHTIHLISKALRVTTERKCGPVLICESLKRMTPVEWKTILENTVTVVESNKINFYTVLDTQIDIVVLGDNSSEIVGYVEEGLILHRPIKRLNRTKSKQCLVDMYEYELEPEVTTLKPTVNPDDDSEERIPINFGYSELLATVVTFPIGLVILIALTILCVYKSTPRKPNREAKTMEDYT